jgi:hypothetical protein
MNRKKQSQASSLTARSAIISCKMTPQNKQPRGNFLYGLAAFFSGSESPSGVRNVEEFYFLAFA